MLSKRIQNAAGLDKAVSVTLLARFWAIIGGLGTLFFVARYLSPELQGYYYTFNSLIALQIFVELGLNFAIIQLASHEMATLHWDSNGRLVGDIQAKRRLQSLMKCSFAWFGVAALLVIMVLLPAGLLFFHTTAPQNSQIRPELAWGLVACFTGITLLLNAAQAILEGCNRVAEVATIRFAQLFGSSLAVWAALANNAGLYSLAVGAGVMTTIGFAGLLIRQRHFFSDLWQVSIDFPGIHWREEIWPFQWRIAVSWASGYLIFQLFSPLLFAAHGPIAAGRMGMSLQVIMAINGAAMVWITTKAPTFGQLIAQNNRVLLDATFKTAVLQSSLALVTWIAIVFYGLLWIETNYAAYAMRVVPPPHFLLLCITCMANHIVFSEAAYLRAHKQEPFMVLSVVTGITTAVLAVILVRPFGYAGAVAAYSFGGIGVGLVGGTIVFMRKRSAWSTAKVLVEV